MKTLLSDLNRRLGLPTASHLSYADASDIFEMCRLEYGLTRLGGGDGDAPWCSVLTPAMIQVLEYDEDLRYYWSAGYGGDDVSYTPACTLVGDLLRHLITNDLVGRFRFTHSGTLNAFYARLRLHRDDQPLLSDNYLLHSAGRRRWTTSRNTPMAANLAFIKYRCDGGGGGSRRQQERVATVINESLRSLPDCDGDLLCPLERLVASWSPIMENCDVDRLCTDI